MREKRKAIMSPRFLLRGVFVVVIVVVVVVRIVFTRVVL